MPSNTEKLASQAYWLPGWGLIMPIQPGTMEAGEMAHVQGLYAGLTYATGGATAVSYAVCYIPMLRGRRR